MPIQTKSRIDDIRFVGAPNEEAESHIRRSFATSPRPVPFDTRDLTWLDEESRVIRSSMRAIDRLLEGLGLEARPIDHATIHVIRPEDLALIRSGKEGLVAQGHAYLPKTSRIAVFAHGALHEFLHLTSFTGIRCRILPSDGDAIHTTYEERRLGTAFISRNRRKEKQRLYAGYNEAITEMIAKDLRGPAIRRMDFSEDENVLFMEREISYVPHVEIVHRLIAEVTAAEPDGIDPYEQLALDYFNGTFGLVRRFEAVHQGSSQALARMETSLASGAECAKTLGYDDVAAAFS